MEIVRAFNNELSGLYEAKPPISRAKMALVTKCAIKAIKFYKHVVQSVEKFIQKCKPEYKVPGLYVIDSVVRQSRHQFGHQKDVFVPRFTRNIINTFQNLFKCPAEERSKIVRVLNLWQKNEVFPSEIVQPLLDLAADPTKPSLIAAAQEGVDKVLAVMNKNSGLHHHQQEEEQNLSALECHNEMEVSHSAAKSMLATQNEVLNTVTHLLLQSNSGSQNLDAQQLQLQQLQLLQQQLIQQTVLMQQPMGGALLIDANLLGQIQALTNQLLQKNESKPDVGGFRKKLQDFDYGDEGEGRQEPEPDIQGDVQAILNNQGLMQQIQHVSQTIQKNNKYSAEISEQEHRCQILVQQQAEFDQQIMHCMPPPPLPFGPQPPMPEQAFNEAEEDIEEQVNDEDFHEQQRFKDQEDRDRREKKHKTEDRSRSSLVTPKRQRKRSRSRERRHRSRSKDSHKRSRSKERSRKEQERERKKKALPAVKANFVTICTATIWIGHLNKFTSEEELKAELERFGKVDNIRMVPPRGCAYVVMENRQDAYKAIDWLKGFKLNGSLLKTAWAQSTGMRESEFKDSWDLDEGAMYLPWDRLPSDLSVFLDGAIIDVDSLPEHLQNIPIEKVRKEVPMPVSTTQSNQFSAQMPPLMSFPGQPPPMTPLPGQPPIMGIMPPPMHGMMPGMMPSMMSDMVMSMQRPMMLPGLPPPPAMPLTLGLAPPPSGAIPSGPPITPESTNYSVVPDSAHISTMSVGRPPVVGVPMSIASSVAATLAQTLQTIMSSTAVPGMMSSSPVAPPRSTGFTPGGPPNFGFNLSMPPPGFQMPPPGFGSPMRPLMPPGSMPLSKPGELIGKMRERPLLMTSTSHKQAEMVWPPDSNEKDDENEEDVNDMTDVDSDPQSLTVEQRSWGPAPNRPPQPGHEQSHIRMLGPPPPGGFPPGMSSKPGNQFWDMNRMAGPRQMGPLLGSRPNIRPLMGGPLRGGSRGPPFVGNMLGERFQRFPNSGLRGPNSNIRGSVSLFDFNVKLTEQFDEEQEIIDNEESFEENPERANFFNKCSENSEENEPEPNAYPWQSMNRNQSRNSFNQYQPRGNSFRGGGNNRSFDNSRGSYGGGRSADRGRDNRNLHNMGRDRLHDWDRDGRDMERRDYGNREYVDRDWRGRDYERKDHNRGEHPQDQDKQKVRKSRWGNWEEEMELPETANKKNCLNLGESVETNISDSKLYSSDFLGNSEVSIKAIKKENRNDTTEEDILSKNSIDIDAECGKIEDVNKMEKVKDADIDNKCDMACFGGMDESKIENVCVTDKNISSKEEGEIENTNFDDTTVKKYVERDLDNVEKIVNDRCYEQQ